ARGPGSANRGASIGRRDRAIPGATRTHHQRNTAGVASSARADFFRRAHWPAAQRPGPTARKRARLPALRSVVAALHLAARGERITVAPRGASRRFELLPILARRRLVLGARDGAQQECIAVANRPLAQIRELIARRRELQEVDRLDTAVL